MDLITVNNTVVRLRGPIQQARVHVIHHLSRQATSLKAKKGSEQQKDKNIRKAERFTKEIQILKEADRDEMAKFAIRSKKRLDQVMASDTADLRLRALARISNHAAVAKIIKEFRNKFPQWEKNIQTILDKLGRKQDKKSPGVKLKKKQKQASKAKTKAGKEVKDRKKKEYAASDENVPDRVDDNLEDAGYDNSDGGDEEKGFVDSLRSLIPSGALSEGSDDEDEGDDEERNGDQSSSVLEEEDEESFEGDSGSDEVSGDNIDDQKDDKDMVFKEVKEKKLPRKENKLFRREGQMEIKTIDMEGSSSEDGDSTPDREERVDFAANKNSSQKSSFFLGGESGSEAEDDDDDDDVVAKPTQTRPRVPKQIANSRQTYARGSGRREFGKQRGQAEGGRERGRGRGRGGFDSHFERSGKRNFDAAAPSLHPSWAAKRKAHESQALHFQGKKTKFDEEGPKVREFTKSNGNINRDSSKERHNNLHPSWAAKKEKSKIVDFKGKKVVFD